MINFKTTKSEIIVKMCSICDSSLAERIKFSKKNLSKKELLRCYSLALIAELHNVGVLLCSIEKRDKIKTLVNKMKKN